MITQTLSHTFAALGDPTRMAILTRLREGPATVGELRKPFTISAPAISRHLKILETAGLIQRVRDRQHLICSLRHEGFTEASDWIEQVRQSWEEQFDKLDEQLKQHK